METPNSKQGSLLGAILLIAGCCIGAGMLGLPVLSSLAGFIPSTVLFVCSWLFMMCTGLLLLEVNLWYGDGVNLITMTGRTLGKIGQMLSWLLFLFLFYSIMVAYVAGSGSLFSDLYEELMGAKIELWKASLAFVVLFGAVIYTGTLNVDWFNRLLMIGLVVTYVALIVLGLPRVKFELLTHADWPKVAIVVPAMIISFGYHNLIPGLTSYLNHDVKRLRTAIIVGSSLPLFVYLLWQFVIMGVVPVGQFKESFDQGAMATHALKNAAGSSWVLVFAEYFAFFSIVTSFLAVAFSFVDFLSDGLKIHKSRLGMLVLCLLTLVPPFVFALSYPQIFLTALNYAGAFGAVILFGIFPALMVWVGRYKLNKAGREMLPGGRFTLVAVIVVALIIVTLQFVQEIGWMHL